MSQESIIEFPVPISSKNPKGIVDKVQYRYARKWLDDNPDSEPSDDFRLCKKPLLSGHALR